MKYFAMLAVGLLLAGCGAKKDNPAPAVATTPPAQAVESTDSALAGVDLMPLKIGNVWIYETSILDTTVGKLVPDRLDTFIVSRDTVINGERWYMVDGMGSNGTLTINREGGQWIIDPYGKPYLIAKFPAAVGDEFSGLGGKLMNRLEKTGVEITVPGGTFYCYQYSQIFGPQRRLTYNYFAPGVGFVKMESMGADRTKPVMVSRLMKAEIK